MLKCPIYDLGYLMTDRIITMSIKELDRVEIVKKCISKTLS